jgi:hypothetical protein
MAHNARRRLAVVRRSNAVRGIQSSVSYGVSSYRTRAAWGNRFEYLKLAALSGGGCDGGAARARLSVGESGLRCTSDGREGVYGGGGLQQSSMGGWSGLGRCVSLRRWWFSAKFYGIKVHRVTNYRGFLGIDHIQMNESIPKRFEAVRD